MQININRRWIITLAHETTHDAIFYYSRTEPRQCMQLPITHVMNPDEAYHFPLLITWAPTKCTFPLLISRALTKHTTFNYSSREPRPSVPSHYLYQDPRWSVPFPIIHLVSTSQVYLSIILYWEPRRSPHPNNCVELHCVTFITTYDPPPCAHTYKHKHMNILIHDQ